MDKTYLALDIGGSAIKYAHMTSKGEFIEKGDIPTPLDTLENLLESIHSIFNKYTNIFGIGISMPGIIDVDNGIAYTGGALLYIKECPFAKLVSDKCGVPVTIGNDAKCAGYAEVGFGSLKDVQDAVALILGTGIGGCIIKDRKVHNGRNFAAGEVSSIQTNRNDPFGKYNTFAMVNGSIGLLRRVHEQTNSNEKMTGREIFELANSGDAKVCKAIDLFCRDLAVQIFNIQSFYDPEKIAIGGGISVQPLVIEGINKHLQEGYNNNPDMPIPFPNVVVCKYGNDANLIGAFYQHQIHQ